MLGAITTVASLGGLAMTSFPAFREMSFFAAVGVSAALWASLFPLRALLPLAPPLPDRSAATSAEIRSHGRRSIAVQADVAKLEDVERLFSTIDGEFGRLDGLVNNAGVGRSHGPFEDCLPEDLRETFEVNVFGLFYCSQAAVRRMSTKHGGSGGAIVNLSSAAARTGGVNAFIDYAA